MVKDCFRFIKRNGGLLFSIVAMLTLAVFGDVSLLMAEATVVAPGPAASEGSEGLNTQMNGQDGSVTAIQNGGETAEIIEEDIDDDIAKFRSDYFVVDTIARKAARRRTAKNYVVKHFNVDASRITCDTSEEYTENVSKKRITLPVLESNASIFQVYDTINVRGVNGFAEDGVTPTKGIDLMLYVVGEDTSTGLPVVIAINGKKNSPDDQECYVPSIPNGTHLYCMSNAGSESQLFCPPANKAPVPREVYLQKRMSNTKFTSYFDMVKKKVAWDKEDIMEDALWEFRRKCEASYLFGVKGKVLMKDSQNPTRGAEYVYFSGGIVQDIKKVYEYTPGAFKFNDFLGITKMMFTGNNGSREAFVGVGKDLLEDMMKVDLHMVKDINVRSREKWGIKFNCFESSFGTLNVVHLPILNEYGMSDVAICLDLDMLVRYKLEEKSKNLDLSVNGEDAQRNVTIMSDALALRGYSHMLIKPSAAVGTAYSSEGMMKVTSSDTLPSTGNSEGDVIHLTADVEATSTNDALSAGMLAQWNGTKWVKYDGDIYV